MLCPSSFLVPSNLFSVIFFVFGDIFTVAPVTENITERRQFHYIYACSFSVCCRREVRYRRNLFNIHGDIHCTGMCTGHDIAFVYRIGPLFHQSVYCSRALACHGVASIWRFTWSIICYSGLCCHFATTSIIFSVC